MLKNAVFVRYLLSKESDLKNSQTRVGQFFFSRQRFWVWTALCYIVKSRICTISPLQVVGFEKSQDNGVICLRETFWVCTALCNVEKCSFCPISPLQVVRFEKFPDKRGSFFSRQRFWVWTALCYVGKCRFCTISPLQVVGFETSQDKMGSFIWDKHFEFE